MRIVGGRWRGAALARVGRGDEASRLRPTADRVREALFNVLTAGREGDAVTGARVLDLFAGTGALGFEALSRGADHVTAVETGRPALRLLEENARRLGAGDAHRILRTDAMRLPPASAAADLVFLDPPYGRDLGAPALAHAHARGWIAPGAVIVWEEAAPQAAPPGFAEADRRRYGGTHLTILRAGD